MALLSRFFGRTVSEGAAYAFGVATGPVLAPATESIRQEAWMHYATRSLDPGLLAEGVAQGQVPHDWAQEEALRRGINAERFGRLVDIANTGPGMAAAFDLWRRGILTDARFRAALTRAAIEPEWIDDLMQTKDVLLSVDQLANAVVQGHMTQDAAAAEAAKQGVTPERFDVLVRNTGLPPGPATGLEWLRRGILSDTEFGDLVREGHTKVKYIPKYLEALHPVLSHATYAGLRLRGWITKAESDAGGALTGYTPEQMELEFLNRGRPATAHQIHLGYARGGSLAGAANEVDAIRTAIQQSDIRPEYADLIVAQRYTYPPFFALRTLAQSHVITEAEMRQALLFEGWEPDFAGKVAAFYAQPAAAAAVKENPYVTKADGSLFTALHKAYVKTGAGRAAVEPILTVLIPAAGPRDVVFARWDEERQAQSLPSVTA